MLCPKEIVRYLLCGVFLLATVAMARPDGGETLPLPGPGLSYGGIPYGSVSGDVAEYFKRQAPSSGDNSLAGVYLATNTWQR